MIEKELEKEIDRTVDELEISVVIPCLNEAKTLKRVIDSATKALLINGYHGEIIVANNGSTDGSSHIAESAGARVVNVSHIGYGNALTAGIEASKGRYIIIGDADGSYDFNEIPQFVEKLRQGYEFVIGTRLKGKIEKGAMPHLHRYIGTPLLTFLVNLFFGANISDVNCGMRGFTRQAFRSMKVHATGMEWASETIIKACLLKIKQTEVPISMRTDKRGHKGHLSPWRDGWYHLRFIVTYAADQLLLIPGVFMILLGLIGFFLLWKVPITINGFYMDFHFLFPSALLIILGVQLLVFTLLAKTYTGLAQYNPALQKLLHGITFEIGLIFGCILFLCGLGINLSIVYYWLHNYATGGLFAIRPAIIALTLMAVGAQIFFSSFFISVLKIPLRM